MPEKTETGGNNPQAGGPLRPIEVSHEETIKETPARLRPDVLLFLLYIAAFTVLGTGLVLSLRSADPEARNLGPTIVTAITTIAGFAVGVNASPKSSTPKPAPNA